MSSYSKWAVVAALCVVPGAVAMGQQTGRGSGAEQTFTVFLRQRPVGQERVTVVTDETGTLVRGSNSLAPPLDVVTQSAEIHYTPQWQPTRMVLDGTARGAAVTIKTRFADGLATSEITTAGQTQTKADKVAADTVVLPNGYLGSYAALAKRLTGTKPGATLHAYIAPQGEVPMRLDGVFAERIETPRESIAVTRYALMVTNPPPGGEMQISVWADQNGRLLRMSVPSQMLEMAREDIASAAARTTSFSIPGEETVHIPASGFNIAASVAKPANATAPLPAVVIVGSVTANDRDGFVGGVPVTGNLAAELVEAGFLVVRYDRRGVGQSGGRAETATINDYAEDVRAIFDWLENQRDDVDDERIALVGYDEGAWIAMRAAARERDIAALGLVQAASTTGAERVLEQQRQMLANAPEADRQAKIELQRRINAAVMKGSGWEGVPETMRSAADTPWFQSYLTFDPARMMRDVRQPVAVVRGTAESGVPPHHADRLLELAQSRTRQVPADAVEDTKALSAWLARVLGRAGGSPSNH
jgi:pimeloyl-ACP methyl ester carboxylesterase